MSCFVDKVVVVVVRITSIIIVVVVCLRGYLSGCLLRLGDHSLVGGKILVACFINHLLCLVEIDKPVCK